MGTGGKLPWHLPADMLHFKALTIGKPVVMGRKTFESIGRPLKLRRNIVLTRDSSFYADGIETARSVEDLFRLTEGAAEIAVIGGAQIFAAFAPHVDAVYATEIDADVEGDVVYRPPQRAAVRTVTGEYPADERNAYAMTFLRYDYR